MNDLLSKFGFMGICISGMAWFIIYLIKGNRGERKEFRDMIERMSDKSDRREDETNKIMREHGNILNSLKTMIENKIK